jgi:hypothetical protein
VLDETTGNHEGAAVGRRITHAVIELADETPPWPVLLTGRPLRDNPVYRVDSCSCPSAVVRFPTRQRRPRARLRSMPKTQSRVSVAWKVVATERTVSIHMTDADDSATLLSPRSKLDGHRNA